jgi:hypothetical protein
VRGTLEPRKAEPNKQADDSPEADDGVVLILVYRQMTSSTERTRFGRLSKAAVGHGGGNIARRLRRLLGAWVAVLTALERGRGGEVRRGGWHGESEGSSDDASKELGAEKSRVQRKERRGTAAVDKGEDAEKGGKDVEREVRELWGMWISRLM